MDGDNWDDENSPGPVLHPSHIILSWLHDRDVIGEIRSISDSNGGEGIWGEILADLRERISGHPNDL